MAVERSAAALLHWSWWRRWHQAWARYYHYRWRQQAREGPQPAAASVPAPAARSDVIEVVWTRLCALLPPSKRSGRPYSHQRHLVLEAIVHVMQTNCGWQHLPSRFPPWQTVYSQLTRWREKGIWDKIWSGLEQPHPTE